MERLDVNLNEVRAFLRAKRDRKQAELADRLRRARADAERIRERIVQEVGPTRIYQWGSLLNGEHFSEISDIDFALEGLAGPAEYSRALGIAMEETTFPVDIIDLDKLSCENRERIVRRGRIVYERRE
ncbi:MAG: nucleotidyltransferase family protein [Spirochaetota bacterium]